MALEGLSGQLQVKRTERDNINAKLEVKFGEKTANAGVQGTNRGDHETAVSGNPLRKPVQIKQTMR